jgi:hypothetical protein
MSLRMREDIIPHGYADQYMVNLAIHMLASPAASRHSLFAIIFVELVDGGSVASGNKLN